MAVNQSHIPTISDAVVELDLSNLGTFTAQNTITIQGEITEVAVSGGDYTTSNLPVLNGTVFTSTGEKQPYEVTVTAVYTEGHGSHTAIAGKDLQEGPQRPGCVGMALQQRRCPLKHRVLDRPRAAGRRLARQQPPQVHRRHLGDPHQDRRRRHARGLIVVVGAGGQS